MWTANPISARAIAAEAAHASPPPHPEPSAESAATYNYNAAMLRAFGADNAFAKHEPHPAFEFAAWFVRRFKIAFCAIPYVGALLLLRWLLWMDPKSPSVAPIDSIIVAPVITCVVFVMSTVYGNVISDYKVREARAGPAALHPALTTLFTLGARPF